MRSRLVTAVGASALALCTTTAILAGGNLVAQAAPASPDAAAAPAENDTPLLRLTSPERVHGYSYNGRTQFDPALHLTSPDQPFEVWSTRPSYKKPIVTEIRAGAGTVVLPEGLQKNFRGLPGFLKFTFRDRSGTLVASRRRRMCLNGWTSERVRPDAPLRSPYPSSRPRNKFTRGSVMGIQGGWSTRLDSWQRVRLGAGKYRVTVSVTKAYRKALGLEPSDVRTSFRLVVQGPEDVPQADHRPRARKATPRLRPAAEEPRLNRTGEPVGVQPDLRSLPAFGIRISKDGNHLQFSATVWNAGDSPLLVDGFRRRGEDVMDAYQYFVDSDGNQTGHAKVGTMEWDAKDTHHHWHFRDFARYRLLGADKAGIVRSRKEAFCLANTDAVDYTVRGADWQPEGTDLHSACGDRDSLSIREVLSAGSGDTYAQFRAGQSFNLRGLPNGTYYIAVEANPKERLVERSTRNNVALRRVRIGGTEDARTVKVGKVGLIG